MATPGVTDAPMPPYDTAAEQALLGAMIASPDIAATAFASVPVDAFWSERHRVIAAAIHDRLRREQPIDPQLLLQAVQNRREVGEGIGPYILTLYDRAWMPKNAGLYAERLRLLHATRELLVLCQRGMQRVGEVGRSGDDIDLEPITAELEAALADVRGLTVPAELPDPPTVLDLLKTDEKYDWLVEGLMERGERLLLTGSEGLGKALAVDTAVPTPKGWTTMGELSVGDEVFSPDGTPTRIIAATGVMTDRPCYRVTFSDGAEIVADEQHLWLTETVKAREAASRFAKKPATVAFRGNDQKHKRLHFPAVLTTGAIRDTLWARGGHNLNHSVDTCQPLQYPAQELPIDPYVLGAWLGDGSSHHAAITSADPEITDQIRSAGYTVERVPSCKYGWSITRKDQRAAALQQAAQLVSEGIAAREASRRVGISQRTELGGARSGWKVSDRRPDLYARPIVSLNRELRDLGVILNKHVPAAYLRASVDQRLALLQGLMDTDGTVAATGGGKGRGSGAAFCEFSVCSERLARDFYELVQGLGIKTTWREAPATLNGRIVGTRYRIVFQTDLQVFRLQRKRDRHTPMRTRRASLRYITAVEPIESVPVRCIQVDRTDGMFVAGRECIPTHNSVMITQLAACFAGGLHPFTRRPIKPLRVAIVDCENPKQLARRRYRSILPQVEEIRARHFVTAPDWQNLFIEFRPDGLNLLNTRDVAWLDAWCRSTAPDVLVLGPIYKLHATNINDETAARELTRVLDMIRTRYNCALISEAHAGNSEDASGRRVMRPIGSSLFRRWPEFGFGMVRAKDAEPSEHPDLVDMVAWRGSREERDWPRHLQHGDSLPWLPTEDYKPSTGRSLEIA